MAGSASAASDTPLTGQGTGHSGARQLGQEGGVWHGSGVQGGSPSSAHAVWVLQALSSPYRMLQNNQLGGIPAEALWELRSLQSL